jgi:hypothetical protein
MTVAELVAQAKRDFPNTRLTDAELEALAKRILRTDRDDPKGRLQQVLGQGKP